MIAHTYVVLITRDYAGEDIIASTADFVEALRLADEAPHDEEVSIVRCSPRRGEEWCWERDVCVGHRTLENCERRSSRGLPMTDGQQPPPDSLTVVGGRVGLTVTQAVDIVRRAAAGDVCTAPEMETAVRVLAPILGSLRDLARGWDWDVVVLDLKQSTAAFPAFQHPGIQAARIVSQFTRS